MHYAKYNKKAVGSILLHSDRGIDSPDTHEHSNESIDKSRTHLNYDLKDRCGLPAYAYYKNRIDHIAAETKERTGKSIRKDAVTLCSWVITAPKDLPEEKLSEFFKATYAWFSERYGESNIVTAAVHMDETTPHIHLQFTPIIEKNGIRKLCAKDIETRKTLQSAHQKLQNHLQQELKCEVNLLNGATEQGNKSIMELKAERKQQQIDEANAEFKKIANIKVKIKNVENIDAKPTMFGGRISLPEKEHYRLVALAKTGIVSSRKIEKIEEENKYLKSENERLKKENKRITSSTSFLNSMKMANTISDLRSQNEIANEFIAEQNLTAEFSNYEKRKQEKKKKVVLE